MDGKEYCVRERKLLNQAADKLAHTTNDLKKLVSYCKTKFPNNPAVKRMVSKFNLIETKSLFCLDFVFGLLWHSKFGSTSKARSSKYKNNLMVV